MSVFKAFYINKVNPRPKNNPKHLKTTAGLANHKKREKMRRPQFRTVRIKIDITRRALFSIITLIMILSLSVASYAVVSHYAEQIRGGTFGGNFATANYTFPGNVTVDGSQLQCTDCVGGSSVNEASLSCTSITGGASLCDGSDADTDTIGISGCSFFSGSTSVACGGGRMTGGVCSCPSGSVTTQSVSVGAGNFGGSITCGCTAGTPTAGAFCCS